MQPSVSPSLRLSVSPYLSVYLSYPSALCLFHQDYDVNGVTCRGYLIDAQLKELLPTMPVMYIRAVAVDPTWEASEVGYLRNDRLTYECPVYTTTFRGPTFVFLATLKVEEGSDTNQWILRAAALITQSD
jgi:dynein heavy chain